jgi:hypothetical protein
MCKAQNVSKSQLKYTSFPEHKLLEKIGHCKTKESFRSPRPTLAITQGKLREIVAAYQVQFYGH